MATNTTVTDGGRETESDTPRTILFPDARLDEVLDFEDELLLALRATKSWQDPATPSWLGSALCALATAIGPMVRLFLPDGLTVTPNFNALITIPSGGSLELNRRLLAPIERIQSRTKGNLPLDNIVTSSFERLELRYQFTRAINGGLTIADGNTDLLRSFLGSEEEDRNFVIGVLGSYIAPIDADADALPQPDWPGSVNMLMFVRTEQLTELAASPLFAPERYPNILVLPEEFTPYDVSCGHEAGFMERTPWNEIIKRTMRFPNFWSLKETRRIDCSVEAAAPLEEFRVEMNDVLKVVHPSYRPFLEWLPDLAARIALTICFAQNQEATFIGSRHMQHAVTITKWLANCHFQGLQRILQVEPLPDTADRAAIPDRQSLILEKLRTKGPMRPREISRSCYRMTASARDHALHWLQERNLVVFRPDGLVQAVN